MENSYTYRLKHSNSMNTALKLLGRTHNIWWRNDLLLAQISSPHSTRRNRLLYLSVFVLFQPSVGVHQAYLITGQCTKHGISWANEKLTPQSNIIHLQHALEMEDGGHVCHHPATEVHSW